MLNIEQIANIEKYIKEQKENQFLSDNDNIDFSTAINYSKIEPLNDYIMMINSSCGRGKTHISLSLDNVGLLARINNIRRECSMFHGGFEYKDIKPEEVLFLVPRKIIKDQQIINTLSCCPAVLQDYCGGRDFLQQQEGKGKIRITTYQQFIGWVMAGEVITPPKVFIMDEFHTLISDSCFADNLANMMDYLLDNYDSIIKIALTATPQIQTVYAGQEFSKLRFIRIDKELGIKYKAEQINIYQRGTMAALVNYLSPKVDKNNRLFVYTIGAKKCYELSELYKDKGADFFISKSSEKYPSLSQLMIERGTRDYICQNERLPNDITMLFCNSAGREGMNLKDNRIKRMVIDACDLINIEQAFGRVRFNIKELDIVLNQNRRESNQKIIKQFAELISLWTNAEEAEKDAILWRRYAVQEHNKDLPKFVYISYKDQKPLLNRYAKAYYSYMDDCYIQISNTEYKRVVSVAGRKLLTKEDYINQLAKFSLDGKLNFYSDMNNILIPLNNSNSMAQFKTIADRWVNIPLSVKDKKALCEELKVIRTKRRAAGWTTIKKEFIANGYQIKQKRIGTKNYDIIIQADNK